MIKTSRSPQVAAKTERKFQPLEHEERAAVDTAAAAFYLSRSEQTLRKWSCLQEGPIRPIRINGRLAWPTATLKKLLGV
ncbi:MAG: DNA-binding protein [Alcaligenaceae bacterium]|nr:MAG: DNA-binding protein [Alcaligenaceae bacterium]